MTRSDSIGKLAGALTFVEGVGNVDVEYVGELDVIPEGSHD